MRKRRKASFLQFSKNETEKRPFGELYFIGSGRVEISD